MSDRCTWAKIEIDDEGAMTFRVSHSKTTGETVVVRHEDALEFLTEKQRETIGAIVNPIVSGLSKRLAAMVDVDAMEVVLSTVKKRDPRLAKLSLEGGTSLDGRPL